MTTVDDFDYAITRQQALAAFQVRDYRQAHQASLKIVQERPDDPEGLAFLAQAELYLGRLPAAKKYAAQALALAPRPDTHSAMARVAQADRDHVLAVEHFKAALQYMPDNINILLPYANSLVELQQWEAALKLAQQAHRILVNEATVTMLTAVYQQLGQLELAAKVLDGFTPEGPPKLDGYLAASLSIYGQLGWFDKREKAALRLEQALNGLTDKMHLDGAVGMRLAFLSQFYGCSNVHKWQLLRRLGAILDPTPVAPKALPARAAERLRLGYLSPNFGDHPSGHLMAPILEAHDRSAFAIYAYSTGKQVIDRSGYPERLRAGAEFWRDCSGQSDTEIAARIAADELDVLIDLGGYLSGGRPRVLALRPAPIQIHWIMHLGGLKAPFFDYSLVDGHMVPEGAEDEALAGRLIRMPHAFQPGYVQPLATDIPPRGFFGLPEQGLVFCAFNNPLKIDREVFSAWMAILRAVPESVLWLSGKAAASGFRAEAERQGVQPERLVFSPRVGDRSVHLARHRHAGLYLDTFVFGGATSSMDALLAGLPVLTRAGDQAYGRIGTGFNRVLGLPELIAETTDDYVEKAIDLAHDNEKLASLKTRVSEAVRLSPLFDARQFTVALEQHLRKLVAAVA